MKKDYFGRTYAAYWKEKTTETRGRSNVPSEKQADFFLKLMKIRRADHVLDLGCGHGRMYKTLHAYSDNITGIDPNAEALKEASKYNYKDVIQGTAEKTTLPSGYFDKIVAWATYDVVSQEKGLAEQNRLLKPGGLLLITGKNNEYYQNDREAFIAERNAYLKDFPNHFTDVKKLLKVSLDTFGFETVAAFAFKRRGDTGRSAYIKIPPVPPKFYEFLIIFRKVKDSKKSTVRICGASSKIAARRARQDGFRNQRAFFKWHKKTHGE